MRSLLFVPGDSERKLGKALDVSADALIVDLEDSVSAERKEAARRLALDFLKEAAKREARPRLYVRINDLTTPLWEADIAAVLPAAPDGVMLPKSRSGEDVRQLSRALHHAERSAGVERGNTRLLVLATEVPGSLLNMGSYTGASSRLDGLTWGAEDLSQAIGATASRDAAGALSSPFRLARDLTLIAAAAAGCAAIDTVYLDFRNDKGLRAESAEAARDGFTGKLAIHPDQVAVINDAFTPPADEVARARSIVRAFLQNPEQGVIGLDGEMLDRPHLARAERVLARARLSGRDSG